MILIVDSLCIRGEGWSVPKYNVIWYVNFLSPVPDLSYIRPDTLVRLAMDRINVTSRVC